MIEIGNIYYFLYMIISIILIVISLLFINKFNPKVQKRIIFCILLSGFIVNIIKIFTEKYFNDLPSSLRKITFENICAVSTIIFPFVFLSKNQKWKDYLYCFGIFGGAGCILFPNPVIGEKAFAFDTFRCYYCHLVLILGALLMVKCGFHKLNYHKLWKVPFTFFTVLCIILLNEILLMSIGFVEPDINLFFDRSYRNSSFIFGPTPAFDKIKPIIDIFVPRIFRIVQFGPLKGEEIYLPIIWMLLPATLIIYLLGFIIYIPFEYEHIKNDLIKLKFKIIKED